MLVQELFHEKRKTSSTTMSLWLIPNGLWSMSLGNFYGVTWLSGCLRKDPQQGVRERQKPSADMSEIRTKWLSKVLLLLLLTKPPPREARIILEPVMLVEVDCGLVTI